jgi:hypothetical protein
LGWIADIFRILWGFLYWNSRKTLFRLRRGRGRCPCQNISDSGLAFQTGCDPSRYFAKPARFRVVCPLLKTNEEGLLRCSVDTKDVRPFWGRVLAGSLGTLVLLYAVAVLGAFTLLRQVGYPVTIQMIGWPPAWSEIDQARSQYFLQNAQEAYRKGDLGETVMSLSLAYDYDSDNYEAGFFLARLWQAGRPEVSNHLYQSLIVTHPDKRTQTAQAWLRSLLPRADYVWIERLSASALRFSDAHAPAWLHALLFANARTGNDDVLVRLLENPETLPPGIETVLRWEQHVQGLPPEIAYRSLQRPAPAGSPAFVVYYQIRRLLSLGYPVEALNVLNSNEQHLGDRDRITLQLRAFAEADFRRSYEGLFDRLTRLPPSLGQFEIITAHLVAHPDPILYRRAKNRLNPSKLNHANEQLPAMLALFCLAGANGDTAYQQELAEAMRALTSSRFAVLDIAMGIMADARNNSVKIENILPALQPMSLDLTYAMLERYETSEF